jgi:hypothetical protein
VRLLHAAYVNLCAKEKKQISPICCRWASASVPRPVETRSGPVPALTHLRQPDKNRSWKQHDRRTATCFYFLALLCVPGGSLGEARTGRGKNCEGSAVTIQNYGHDSEKRFDSSPGDCHQPTENG